MWLSVCVLTIWYFLPFGNAGLQSPRDLPSPYTVSTTQNRTLRDTPRLTWLRTKRDSYALPLFSVLFQHFIWQIKSYQDFLIYFLYNLWNNQTIVQYIAGYTGVWICVLKWMVGLRLVIFWLLLFLLFLVMLLFLLLIFVLSFVGCDFFNIFYVSAEFKVICGGVFISLNNGPTIYFSNWISFSWRIPLDQRCRCSFYRWRWGRYKWLD